VKNRKPTTLQMTKGHCFHVDPMNKCFTIQPFTRTDTLHLSIFSKRCNVSLWDFHKPTVAFDNPAYCATAMPQTKQCQTGMNIGTHCPPERPHTLNMQAIRRSHNKPNTSQEGEMGFACTCLSRWSLPTLPPMCYQVERVKNRKATMLQMAKGQYFHVGPTNECFTIQPFTQTDTCLFPSSANDVTFLS
jgi:hypothetical protein